MKLLGWLTIGVMTVGVISYVYLQFFTEMTVQRKAWFILGIGVWGLYVLF